VIEETLSAGSSGLSYDSLADQYVYVWKTDKSWSGCRQLTVKLSDGVTHTATFKFTKEAGIQGLAREGEVHRTPPSSF